MILQMHRINRSNNPNEALIIYLKTKYQVEAS